jgi:UDP-N-acetylglucosamine 3-dehydrogenase
MNFAIIGLGYWGKNYYRILNSNDKINLSAIVDSNQNINLDEGIKHFLDLEDLLNSEINIDAAIIATPTNTHYEITKKLLNNGIHVLVEKPLSTKADEASELINLANEKNLVLLVDHTFLYNEAINFAIKSIQDGEIGSLLHINFERTNLGPIRSDVSCLWDLTTHDVSILNAITPNEPTQIRASSFNTSQTEAFDMVNVSLNYENNLFVTMFSSWLHPEKTRKIKIVGDKKMIVFDDLNFNEPIKIYDKKFDQIYDKEMSQNNNNSFFSFSIGDVVSPFIQNSEPLQQVVKHFMSSIENDETFISNNNNEIALRTVSLLENIEKEISS